MLMRMANDTIQTNKNGRSSQQQQKIDNINKEENANEMKSFISINI